MAIIFHLLIFLYANILFVASITLDVFYPEDMLMLPEYNEMCLHNNYIRPINSNKFGCTCTRPCQCHNTHPPPIIYNSPPVQYSPPVYQPPPTTTQQPVIIPPPIFSPTPPTIPSVQQFPPIFQSEQEQTKMSSNNYEHSHSTTQQRSGRFIRRQSSLSRQPQIYFPTNQYYNFPNHIKTNYKRSARSIFIRGRDSRSPLESSKIQNGNDVAPSSSIITPQQQQLNNAIRSNIKNKRHNTNPVVFSRGHNTTTIKTEEYQIVGPSRKLVKTGSKSTPSQSRSSFNSADNIYVNYPHGNSNNNFGISHSGLDIKNMVIDNARSSGLNGIKIFYPNDHNYVHPTNAGQRQFTGNLQITPVYYNPYVYTPRPMK